MVQFVYYRMVVAIAAVLFVAVQAQSGQSTIEPPIKLETNIFEFCVKLGKAGRGFCENDLNCMLVRDYQCVPAANRCQTGFRQHKLLKKNELIKHSKDMHFFGMRDESYDPKAACEEKQGCRFVPAGLCYCPPTVDCKCGGGTPPDCVPDKRMP